MTHETGPKPDADPLRDRLLGQWEPRQSSYLTYRKEIETMLENQENLQKLSFRWPDFFPFRLWLLVPPPLLPQGDL